MMEFRIADTFTQSLARLQGNEQKAAKTAAFDLQLNPAHPGLQMHRLDKAKDKGFWSVRVNLDLRLIVHRTEQSLLLCYVGHHDDAYRWAERRKIERHPRTGAMQLVEIREMVREIETIRHADAVGEVAERVRAALEGVSESRLLEYGVPTEWVEDLLRASEDELLDLADHLPAEAAEAVLSLATGVAPALPATVGADEDGFGHPDAQRRFRLMTDVEELRQALEFPWDRWAVFLHPAQQGMVERAYNGPARVSGSAGTGKTVVAVHRAVHLARKHAGARVLLTTFSTPLARNLRAKVDRLVGGDAEVCGRIAVRSLDAFGLEMYESAFGKATVPTGKMMRALIQDEMERHAVKSPVLAFFLGEWHEVVDAWQIETWEAYRDVQRLGRKSRLGEKQRAAVWPVFEAVRRELRDRGLVSMAMVFQHLTRQLLDGGDSHADYVVVDEAQDISVPQLRYLAALAGEKEDGLFFAGDLGQRIFQTPFSWSSLGVDVRGRSQTLRINYRMSHQIRRQADRLLHPELSDLDGNMESRRGTVSAFSGPEPEVRVAASESEEAEVIADWLRSLVASGTRPGEIAVFVRSEEQLPRAWAAVRLAGVEGRELGDDGDGPAECVALCTMHRAKGLEFKAVVVAACDDEVVPLQSRIETVSDDADLSNVYNTERHLLYVACTRARDALLITGVEPASEYLEDLVTDFGA